MSQKIHPFFRQTAGEAQALYERKRIADMLICSNWMRHPTLTVKATFTSGEVNFNNSIIDHFRLSDSDHTQTSLRKYTIGYPEIFSHTAWFYRFSSFFKKDQVGGCSFVGEVGWRMAVGATNVVSQGCKCQGNCIEHKLNGRCRSQGSPCHASH